MRPCLQGSAADGNTAPGYFEAGDVPCDRCPWAGVRGKSSAHRLGLCPTAPITPLSNAPHAGPPLRLKAVATMPTAWREPPTDILAQGRSLAAAKDGLPPCLSGAILVGMSSDASPCRIRSLLVACLAVGIICSGFSLPLVSSAEASVNTSSPPETCCCGLDGRCGMGCCVVQAPTAPDSPIPASRSNERPSSFSVLHSQAGLVGSGSGAVPRAQHALQAASLLPETSLQSLQVRLDV